MSQEARFCHRCGTQLTPGHRFCIQCGAEQQPQVAQQTGQSSSRRYLLWLVLALALLLTVVASGAGLFLLLGNSPEEPPVVLRGEADDKREDPAGEETPGPAEAPNIAAGGNELNATATNTPPLLGMPTINKPSPTASTTDTPVPPTATPLPSPTLPPPASPTAMISAEVFAEQLTVTPVVDGELSEWNGMPSVRSAYRVFENSAWDGSADVETIWFVGWDSDYLYLAAAVVDDIHVQNQTGNQVYRGDSLEIQLDVDLFGDPELDRLSPDDYQFELSPGNFRDLPPSAYRLRGAANGAMQNAPGHSVRVAARRTSTGYTLEAAIPWTDVGVRPEPELVMGLALNASDNDRPGTAVQEIMISNVSSRTFSNPQTWGRLILQ